MMRLLAFDFREDPGVRDVADQYMLGPSLMICPVTNPMYYGPDSRPLGKTDKGREVYLPAGADWYDFWTERFYTGGQAIVVECPLERIPVFVKAGSILPLGTAIEHTDMDQDISLKIYSGADAEFEIYTDAGDGYAYEEGDYSMNRIRWNDSEQSIEWGGESRLPFQVVTPCQKPN